MLRAQLVRGSCLLSLVGLSLALSGCGDANGPTKQLSAPASSRPVASSAEAPASQHDESLPRFGAVGGPVPAAGRPGLSDTASKAAAASPNKQDSAQITAEAGHVLLRAAPAFEAPASKQSDGEFRSRSEPLVENSEAYDRIAERGFLRVTEQPLSTFSIDVDTASYANVRRFLNQGQWPPADAVRIEELINYFPYADAPPTNDEPFAVHAETASCPWQPNHRLVRVSLKGKTVDARERGLSNLVFLIDVSGSMGQPNKLPLVQKSLRMLVEQLGENDRVAIVVYAGNSGLVLPSTTGDQKEKIQTAIERLQAGGSTNGGAGIELAYRVAKEHKIPGGTNRVILCTDGDFNVGITDRSQLLNHIKEQAKSGVFLSVLGYGMGNLKDATMEQLADKGNGNYAYIDSQQEARKVFVEQMTGTLMTIAKDVKIQIEFNPGTVAAYRLIGYENRLMAAKDFRDDTKDAGEIGAGHTVTALYELVPAGKDGDVLPVSAVTSLRYQQKVAATPAAESDELLTLMLRYKQPEADTSREIRFSLVDKQTNFDEASADYRFSAAVAAFGMILRQSEWKGTATFHTVADWATAAVGEDPNGHRKEFLNLLGRAAEMRQDAPRINATSRR